MLKKLKLTIFTLLFALGSHTYAASNASWDIDKNGRVDALTDSLLLLRHLFDVSGASLTDGAISPDSPLDHNGILSSIDDTMAIADIDGSGHVDALTDALILLRYLFDVSGDLLIDSAIYPLATRSTHSIVTSYIKSKMPGQVSGGEDVSGFTGYWSAGTNSQNELLFTPDGYVAAYLEGSSEDYNFNSCFGSYSQGGNQINVNLDCSSYSGNTSIGLLTAKISANGNSLEILTHDGLMASDDYIFTNDTTVSNDYFSASNTNVIPGIYELEDISPTVFIEVKSTGEINSITNSIIGGTLDTQDCIIDGDIKPNPIYGLTNQDNPVSVLDGSVNISNCFSYYSGDLNVNNQTAIYSAYKETESYDPGEESYYYLDILTQDFTLYAELVCDVDYNPTYFMFDEYSASFCDGFKDDYSPPQDDYFGNATVDTLVGYWGYYYEGDENLILSHPYNSVQLENDIYDCYGSYSTDVSNTTITLFLVCFDEDNDVEVSKTLSAKISSQGSIHFIDSDGLNLSSYLPKLTSETNGGNDRTESSPVTPGIYYLWDYDNFVEISMDGQISSVNNTFSGYSLNCDVSGQITVSTPGDTAVDGNLSISNCEEYDGTLVSVDKNIIATGFTEYHSEGINNNVSIYSAYDELDLTLVCDTSNVETYFVSYNFSEYENFCSGFEPIAFENASPNKLVGHWVANNTEGSEDYLVLSVDGKAALGSDEDYGCYGSYSISGSDVTVSLDCFDYEGVFDVSVSAKLVEGGNRLYVINATGISGINNSFMNKADFFSDGYETLTFTSLKPGIYSLDMGEYVFVEVTSSGVVSTIDHPDYQTNCIVSANFLISSVFDVTDGELSISNCLIGEESLSESNMAVSLSSFESADGGRISVDVFTPYGVLWADRVCDENLTPDSYYGGFESDLCEKFDEDYVEPIAFENASPNKLVGHWVANSTEGSEDYLVLSVDGKAALGSDEDYGCYGSYSISGSDVTVSLDCFDYEGVFDVSISAKLVEGGNRLYVINATGISGINNSFTNKADGFSDGYETFTFTSLKPGIYSLDMDDYVFVEVTSSGEVSTIDHPDYQTNCIVSANFEISSVFDVADGVLSISNCLIGEESFSESNMAASLSTYETEDGQEISVDVFTPYGVLWADRVCDENLTPTGLVTDGYYGDFGSDLCVKFDEDYVEPINTNPNPTVNDLVGFWGEYDAYYNGNYIKLSRDQSIAVETENYRCLGSYTILNDVITAPLSCIGPNGYVYSSSITFGLNADGGMLIISDSDLIDLESNLSRLSVKTYDWYDAESTNITPGIYYIDDMGRLFVEVSASGQINTVEHPSYPPYADYPCSFTGNISNSSLYDSVADGSVTISGCRDVSNWASGWGNVNANSSNTQAVFTTINQNFENPDPETYTRLDIHISNYKFSAELVCDDQLMPTGLGTGAAWASDLCDGFIQNPDNGSQPDNSLGTLLESGIWIHSSSGVVAEFAFSDGLATLNVVIQQQTQNREIYMDCIGSYILEYSDSVDGNLDCSVYYYSTIDYEIGLAQSFTASIYGEIYDENEPSLVFEIPEVFNNSLVYYRSINPTTVPSSGIYAVYGMVGEYVQISGGSIETYSSNYCNIYGSIDMDMQEGISNGILGMDGCNFDDNMEFMNLNPNSSHDVIYKGVDLADGYKIHFTAPGNESGNTFWSSFKMVCDAYGNPTDYAYDFGHYNVCPY